jgi:hypothetical protein
MSCQKCESERILSIHGKTGDMCHAEFNGIEHDGYVPRDANIGGGDYLKFSVCCDCGQMQGQWPLVFDLLPINLRRR